MGLAISTEILTRLFRRSRPGHSSHSDLSHLPLTSEGLGLWVQPVGLWVQPVGLLGRVLPPVFFLPAPPPVVLLGPSDCVMG